MRIERDAVFTTDDGEHLKADIYRPDTLPAPVILQRTPYTKDWHAEVGEAIARAGYIGIVQDVRGQNASTGTWDPFVNEADDGAAAVEWAAGVDGSDGRVAMIGTSYGGATALKAATRRPKPLVAVVAAETPADYYDDNVFPGGALALAFIETWLLRNIANSAAGRLSRRAGPPARDDRRLREPDGRGVSRLSADRPARALPGPQRNRALLRRLARPTTHAHQVLGRHLAAASAHRHRCARPRHRRLV